MLEQVSVIVQGDVETHHFFCVCSQRGAVILKHEVAFPSIGEFNELGEVPFPAEKARELGKMLIRYADEAEK